MARTFRTQKRAHLAERRISRTRTGEVRYPRVVQRTPRDGDSHPADRRFVANLLRLVPVEYLYGLKRIELRARQSEEVGKPFGLYLPDEKTIILYSLPMEWSWKGISPRSRLVLSMRRFFAEIRHDDGVLHIRWPEAGSRSVWFYSKVLSHHHRNQYRARLRPIGSRDGERAANLRSRRLFKDLVKQLRSRRARSSAV